MASLLILLWSHDLLSLLYRVAKHTDILTPQIFDTLSAREGVGYLARFLMFDASWSKIATQESTEQRALIPLQAQNNKIQ